MPPLNVPRARAPVAAPVPSPVPSQPSSSSQSHPFVHTAIGPRPKRVQPQTASSSSTNTPASSVASLPRAPKARKPRPPRGRGKRASSDEDEPPRSSSDDNSGGDNKGAINTDEAHVSGDKAKQVKQDKAAAAAAEKRVGGPASSTPARPPPPSTVKPAGSLSGAGSNTPSSSVTPSSASPAPAPTVANASVAATKAKKKKNKKVKPPKVTPASSTLAATSSGPSSVTSVSKASPSPQTDKSPASEPAPAASSSTAASSAPPAAASSSASTSNAPLVGGSAKLSWSDDLPTDSPLPEIDFADFGKADLGLVAPPGAKTNPRPLSVPASAARVGAPSPNPSTASSSSTRYPVGRANGPLSKGPRPNVIGLPRGPPGPSGPPVPAATQMRQVEIQMNVSSVGGKRVFGPTTTVPVQPSPPARISPALARSTHQPPAAASTSISAPPSAGPLGPAASAAPKSKRALKREKVERKIQKMKDERERRFGPQMGAARPAEPSFSVPPAEETRVVATALAGPSSGAVRVKLPGLADAVAEVKKSSARALKLKARKERERAERDARRQAAPSGLASAAKVAEEVVVRLPVSRGVAAERPVPSLTRTDSVAGERNETPAPSDLASSIHSAVTPPQSEPTHLIIEHPQPRRHPSETNVLYKSPPAPESAALPVQPPMISPPVIINLGPTTAIGLAASASPSSAPLAPAETLPPLVGDRPVMEADHPPRYELPPGRPHPRDDFSHRQSFSQPPPFQGQNFGPPHPGQAGQGGYAVVDGMGRRISGGRDSPIGAGGGYGGGGGMPALPPGFHATESGQVYDAMGQQYVFTYPPPPPPQPFLPPHLRQQSPSPAFWAHGQPSPQFASMSPPLAIGPDGHYLPGPGYSPTSPAYADGPRPYGFDHQAGYGQQPSYPQQQPYAPYPPQQFHPNGPPPAQHQHQHVPPGQYPSQLFVPRRQGFAPVRISDPKAGGGMMASSHLPMHPKASMSFQPVSYSNYHHHDDRAGPPPGLGGRSTSFDSDRTNEAYGGGQAESFTYQ